jgi:hypothetical protein
VRLSNFRSRATSSSSSSSKNNQRSDCDEAKDNCRVLFRTSQRLGFPWGMSMAKQAQCGWAAFLDVDEYLTPAFAVGGGGGRGAGLGRRSSSGGMGASAVSSEGSVANWFRSRAAREDWAYLRYVLEKA